MGRSTICRISDELAEAMVWFAAETRLARDERSATIWAIGDILAEFSPRRVLSEPVAQNSVVRRGVNRLDNGIADTIV